MELSTKKLFVSEAKPGIRYTLRVLNVVQRAKMSLSIVEHQIEYANLASELESLIEPVKGKLMSDLAVDLRQQINGTQTRMALLLDAYIKPVTIQAALISIEQSDESDPPKWTALRLDNAKLTGEAFITTDLYEAIADEMFANAGTVMGMTSEQQRNFQSPSDSPTPGDGTKTPTTASSVSETDNGVAATAPSTTPTT